MCTVPQSFFFFFFKLKKDRENKDEFTWFSLKSILSDREWKLCGSGTSEFCLCSMKWMDSPGRSSVIPWESRESRYHLATSQQCPPHLDLPTAQAQRWTQGLTMLGRRSITELPTAKNPAALCPHLQNLSEAKWFICLVEEISCGNKQNVHRMSKSEFGGI